MRCSQLALDYSPCVISQDYRPCVISQDFLLHSIWFTQMAAGPEKLTQSQESQEGVAPMPANSCSLLEVGVIWTEATTSASNTQGLHLHTNYPQQ
ncbi:rCG35103 [Rattus norvegicus]|uniref:RCG35103 n=1 Tax=Rattus norvegicus TaxID=10116 RepID=A6HL96_RAT|nr:rCG35103 [Rattus norvegicus]